MKIEIKNLPQSEVELTIELTETEVQPFMDKAAQKLSTETKIEGFRPGKASYDIIKARFGEYAILETAAESIIMKNFYNAITEHNLQTVGSPKIDVIKMAVHNPFIFKATVAVLPEIKIGEYKNLNIAKSETKIEDKQVDEVLQNLTKMQNKETLKEGKADKTDKVVIDMQMSKDNVPLEGGQTQNMTVYLSEEHYIPGFNEELIGLEKNNEKGFALKFPKEHFQKNLADKDIHFKIKVKDVFKIDFPELNDDFAKTLGQKSLEDLKKLIKHNLEHEALHKDEEKWEVEVLNKIVENSKFGDMPEILINDEVVRMLNELQQNVAKQGMNFEDYLKGVNKTEAQLKLDFSPEAVKRLKISLIIRAIAEAEKIIADEKEIAEETEKMLNSYKDDADAQKQIRSPQFSEYIKNKIQNIKTIELIKKENGFSSSHACNH